LDREIARVASAPEGERHRTLYSAGRNLGELIEGGELPRALVESSLTEAAERAGLVGDRAAEVAKTIHDGIEKGLSNPRHGDPLPRPRSKSDAAMVMPSGDVPTELEWMRDEFDGDAEPESEATVEASEPAESLEPVADAKDDDEDPASGAVTAEAHLTDLGNARRFVAMHRDVIRYVPIWKKWLVWDGRCWKRDDLGTIHLMARDTVATMYADAAREEDADRRKKLVGHALASESEKRLRAMVSLAEFEEGIAIRESVLDADPWALTVRNGTLDLRTGELRAPDPTDLLTCALDVPYDPAAKCPRWKRFLDQIFNADVDLGRFVQCAVGYSLTGSTREQVFIILFGSGANGKSTFLETLRAMLGPLAQSARFESFLVKRGDAIPNDVARMRGARLITASESEGGKRLSESILKQLTGGDTVSARFLHGEFFDFEPTGKVWLCTNHKPDIRGTDLAIWRRVRLVPFTVTIPEAERDRDLPQKLREELPGVLAWAVAGCRDWYANGLGTADAVVKSTDEYRHELDTLGDFLDECCDLGPDLSVTSGDLYAKYKAWAEKGGTVPLSQRTLKLRLEERADGLRIRRANYGVRTWEGVTLR
jgi:putative DNA primase/helicase